MVFRYGHGCSGEEVTFLSAVADYYHRQVQTELFKERSNQFALGTVYISIKLSSTHKQSKGFELD